MPTGAQAALALDLSCCVDSQVGSTKVFWWNDGENVEIPWTVWLSISERLLKLQSMFLVDGRYWAAKEHKQLWTTSVWRADATQRTLRSKMLMQGHVPAGDHGCNAIPEAAALHGGIACATGNNACAAVVVYDNIATPAKLLGRGSAGTPAQLAMVRRSAVQLLRCLWLEQARTATPTVLFVARKLAKLFQQADEGQHTPFRWLDMSLSHGWAPDQSARLTPGELHCVLPPIPLLEGEHGGLEAKQQHKSCYWSQWFDVQTELRNSSGSTFYLDVGLSQLGLATAQSCWV